MPPAGGDVMPVGGGETQKDPSGWSVDTLHQHFNHLIEALREWARERFGAQEQAVGTALAAHERMLAEMDKRYEQRFIAQQEAVSLALSRVDKEFHEHIAQVRTETTAALDASDKAITKSEEATEKRFESVNEFRAQLTDQAQRFMPRAEAEQRANSNAEKITALEQRISEAVAQINSRLDLNAGSSAGADKYRATLFALLAAAATAVGLGIALLGR